MSPDRLSFVALLIVAATGLAACDDGASNPTAARPAAPQPSPDTAHIASSAPSPDTAATPADAAAPADVAAPGRAGIDGAWRYRYRLGNENFIGIHDWATAPHVSLTLIDIGTISFGDDGHYESEGGTAARILGGPKELVLQYVVEETGTWHREDDRLTMQVETWTPTAHNDESAAYLPGGARPMFADPTGRTHVFNVVRQPDGRVELRAVDFLPGAVIALEPIDATAQRPAPAPQ